MGDRGLALIALGGNAIAPSGTAGTADEQRTNIGRTMRHVAELVARGWQVVLTHGNGPQVGNLLVKNELAQDVVPPMPLDWCVAQTQATVGHTMANTLDIELLRRELDRLVVPLTSRVLVAADDPAFDRPTKPIGRWIADERTVRRLEDEGQTFTHDPRHGWRRVVASPEPLESLERRTIAALVQLDALVIANGGGGVPTVRRRDGTLQGVEAVIDKDLAGAMLAAELEADTYTILTDVPGVALGFGTDAERWLQVATVAELRDHLDADEFGSGSMGPKVEAVCRFVERTGGRAAIAALGDVVGALDGRSGTQVGP